MHARGSDQAPQGPVLICRDCGRSFTFTPGEQWFFDEHGLQSPKRCAACRRARRRAGLVHYTQTNGQGKTTREALRAPAAAGDPLDGALPTPTREPGDEDERPASRPAINDDDVPF